MAHSKVSRSIAVNWGGWCLCFFLWAVPLATAQVNGPTGFKPYEVRNIGVNDAAGRLRSLLGDAGESSEVLIDRSKGRVLVQGSAAAHEMAAQILKTIDQPRLAQREAKPESKRVVRGYRVPADELEQIATQLRREFPEGSNVRVATDPRTSQVIIVGGSAAQDRVLRGLRQAGKLVAPPSPPQPATGLGTNPAVHEHCST